MKITLKQLEIFTVVAKNKTMNHAAEKLHLTQSACSMALLKLEQQLSSPLFNRYGKKLILNEQGRVLLPKALNILTQIQELTELPSSSGNLLLGASSTIGNYVLPAIIGKFVNAHPHSKISLQVGNTQQIINQLLAHEIDIGIIEGRCHLSQLKVLPWLLDELIIIASPLSPLAKKRNVSMTDLQQQRWILREQGSGTRQWFDETTHHEINPFLELGHTEAIKKAVQADLGISCLSKLTVTDELKNKKLIQLKTSAIRLIRHFYLVLHKEKYQTKLLDNFIQCCLATQNSHHKS